MFERVSKLWAATNDGNLTQKAKLEYEKIDTTITEYMLAVEG